MEKKKKILKKKVIGQKSKLLTIMKPMGTCTKISGAWVDFRVIYTLIFKSPHGTVVKNLPANSGDTGDLGSIPGSGRSPGVGNDNPLQYFLPGKSRGQRSLVGYSPWGSKDSDTTEQLSTHTLLRGMLKTHTSPTPKNGEWPEQSEAWPRFISTERRVQISGKMNRGKPERGVKMAGQG